MTPIGVQCHSLSITGHDKLQIFDLMYNFYTKQESTGQRDKRNSNCNKFVKNMSKTNRLHEEVDRRSLLR